ncbi:hypothetical protein CUMW_237710 [Citrus unshiu]|nr:hypothetical protein CUMW_237710 [Citrus unshiu]
MMLISWATRIAEPPKTGLEFWKTLFLVYLDLDFRALENGFILLGANLMKNGKIECSVCHSKLVSPTTKSISRAYD